MSLIHCYYRSLRRILVEFMLMQKDKDIYTKKVTTIFTHLLMDGGRLELGGCIAKIS
jgi:hypothetical protein